MNENKKVRLIEIERFAIHDGPGIRTVVFLQGCPLRCLWCANPESQEVGNHLLHNEKKCVKCGRCARACPHGYISFRDGSIHFDRRDCGDCRLCMEACPQSAIRLAGMDMSVDEIMKVILRDRDYYSHSGGGVTFSGGEAIMQIDSLLPLLEACKKENIHTAVETCGQVSESSVRRILPLVDLFLYDVKHIDGEKFKAFTKGNLDIVMSNLSLIARSNPQKVVIRVPCIPGFNLADEFFSGLFSLANRLGIRRVDLLPYHTLGWHKYEQMGLQPPYREEALKAESLEKYKKQGEDSGLDVGISK